MLKERAGCIGPVVCHISTVHPPFDTRIFHKECRSLVQAGYEVHLIAQHTHDEDVHGVHIHALPQARSRLDRMLRWPILAERRLMAIRPRPRLCHLHDPELLPLGQWLRLKGFRVVFDVHENIAGQLLHKDYLSPLLRMLAAGAYSALEWALVTGMATVHVLDSIAERYRSPKTVLRNLPLLDVAPPPIARPSKERFRLLYLGSMATDRGAMLMIDLANELRSRGIDCELRVVGPVEANLLQGMRAAADRYRLGDHCCFVGPVPYEEAQAEIAAADVGLCLFQATPNRINSLPVKMLEYMRHGVPVVASDFTAWHEYFLATGAGLAVDIQDLSNIADNVQKLLGDAELRRTMGHAGRQAVERRFHWESEQQRLLAFYEQLLS